MTVPPEAVTAALEIRASQLGETVKMLEAAAPHIRAAERERIRQLMIDNYAHYDCDPCYGTPAADLIGGEVA